MPATTGAIFDFLEQHQTCAIQRHEIVLAAFGTLRRHLRTMVLQLRDCEDYEAQELSGQIRSLVSEWLTVPMQFDEKIPQAIETLGTPIALGARWGASFQACYQAALAAARDLAQRGNPIRQLLLSVISDLRSTHRSFKIFCHRKAQPHFESLVSSGEAPLAEELFIHSVREYRDVSPFDVLVKVGPLRSRGWGSAPDALLTAPRFATLVQVVWSGCNDEVDFGYDPASPTLHQPSAEERRAAAQHVSQANRVSWTRTTTRSGDDPSVSKVSEPDADDLQFFRDLNQPREKRRATLLQIDEEEGILYPPYSQVLSFDPSPQAAEPLDRRMPGETLLEGMFIIRSLVGDIEGNGPQTAEGRYAPVWKDRLQAEYERSPAGLISRLLRAGLILMNMHACIKHWCRPTTAVIHAPQKMTHFKILIEVLGISFESAASHTGAGVAWWQYAWNEIRRTRGDAIQSGLHEQEILEEQALRILREFSAEIRNKAAGSNGFHFSIPPGRELAGAFLFNRVFAIEDGFLAPETELKTVRELNSIEQWRD